MILEEDFSEMKGSFPYRNEGVDREGRPRNKIFMHISLLVERGHNSPRTKRRRASTQLISTNIYL
jgi:hypothetical protein